jgi:hypothetical protein
MSLLKFLTTAAVIYALAAGAMTVFQRSFQYFPDTSAMDPARAGFAGAESIAIKTADGETLVAWWKPPADDKAAAYLYFHGNGGNLMLRGERFALLARDGSGVLALSWRGYGGSTGRPTEPGLHLDASAAFAWLQQRVAPKRIVLFGESLGSAPAIRLAADREVGALILDSPFSSALDIARSHYFWLPVRLLMQDQFLAIEDAPAVRAPVLAVHCRTDPVIPLRFAEALVAAIPAKPALHVIERNCHVPPLTQWPRQPGEFVRKALAP